MVGRGFGYLGHDGHAHGDVKPEDQMLDLEIKGETK
jgi:hypothetical protein